MSPRHKAKWSWRKEGTGPRQEEVLLPPMPGSQAPAGDVTRPQGGLGVIPQALTLLLPSTRRHPPGTASSVLHWGLRAPSASELK